MTCSSVRRRTNIPVSKCFNSFPFSGFLLETLISLCKSDGVHLNDTGIKNLVRIMHYRVLGINLMPNPRKLASTTSVALMDIAHLQWCESECKTECCNASNFSSHRYMHFDFCYLCSRLNLRGPSEKNKPFMVAVYLKTITFANFVPL